MTATTRRSLLLVLRLAVSAGLLAFILSRVDLPALAGSVASASPLWLVGAMAGNLALSLAMMVRWRLLIAALRRAPGIVSLLRIFFVASFLGVIAPGSLGIDAARVFLLRRQVGSGTTSALTVTADRLLGMAGYLTLAVVPVYLLRDSMPGPLVALAGGGALAAVIGVPVLWRLGPAGFGALERVSAGRFAAVEMRLGRLRTDLRTYRSSRGVLLAGYVLSVLGVLSWAGAAFCILAALGVPVPFLPLLGFVALGEIASAVPISFQGVGVRELLFITLLQPFGVSMTQATALGLLLYVLLLVNAAVGGALTLGSDLPNMLPGRFREASD